MSYKKLLEQLHDIEGAVKERYNPHLNVLETQSPSVNYTFGKGWGLPQGASLLLWGAPKGGKSLICYSMIAQLHKNDPEAIAIRFDCEMKERFQFGSEEELHSFGIDPERYIVFEKNGPQIFNDITNKINDLCARGLKVKMVIIDPISGVMGRKMSESEEVEQVLIGDDARTIQDGLKRVLEVQRKHRFSLILTAQERANMDDNVRWGGPKTKAAVSFAVKHHCEYWMHVARIEGKSGKTSWAGEALEDKSVKGFNDNAGELTGHRIRVTMTDASFGAPKNRKGEFTIDYKRGVVGTHEELFVLGTGYGIIERPNNQMYVYQGKQWRGQPAMLSALKQDPELCESVLQDLKKKDLEGKLNEVAAPPEAPSEDTEE